MRMNRYLSLILVTACMAVLGQAPATQAQVTEKIDEIVALVDEDIVLRSELDTAIQGIEDRIRVQGGNLPPRDLLEKQVLERLVLRKLQVQRAFQTGIRVSDADIDQAITVLAEQNGMTIAQMRQVIESDGEDFGEFRRSVGEELMTERLRQRVISSMDPISDTEIDILLASEDYAGGEYHISHIMLNLPEGATPQQVQEVSQQASEIHARLEEGLDFTSAAISYSQSEEALDGGEVGWRDLNSIPREFAVAIRNLRAGQFTVPLRSPAGFHIIKVNEYRDMARVMARETRARHILIEANELMTPRDAMEQARDLRRQLEEGADFAELAKEYSDDVTSANIGGDMGWFPEGSYGDRIDQILSALDTDEISEPFQSQLGWHIMQKLGYRETDITEEAKRNQARNSIMQNKADAEVQQYLRQIREEAFVELRLQS